MDQRNQNSDANSFAELFEGSQNSVSVHLNPGQKLSVRVISIGKDFVYFDTGTRMDGVIEKKELLDPNGSFPYIEGEMIDLYVAKVRGGEVYLSSKVTGSGVVSHVREAFENELAVEGKVTEVCKGGLRVEINKKSAFCPISQIDSKYVEDASAFVGKTFEFLITQFEEEGRNIVVSRRKVIEKQNQEAKDNLLEDLRIGQIFDGRVTKLMPFGAFVELVPGTEGMVHISELSWARVEKPEEILQVGDSVRVKVLSVTPSEREGDYKISLSIKQTLSHPWDNAEDKIRVGEVLNGKVTNITKFGAFIEIAEGIEGLVPLSEMSYVKRIHRAEEIVNRGDIVPVLVKECDLNNQRVLLSIRDAEGDPWLMAQEKYKPGLSYQGKVEKIERYGLFVCLEPGISGLLHRSKFKGVLTGEVYEKAKVGDMVRVLIEGFDLAERKISLGVMGDEQESENWNQYNSSQTSSSFGSLGDQLQKAMNKKK